MAEPYKIGDNEYTAENTGGLVWIVRRFPVGGSSFEEAEITSASSEPIDVIRQAIERGSWA
jgi:hypothetical protein